MVQQSLMVWPPHPSLWAAKDENKVKQINMHDADFALPEQNIDPPIHAVLQEFYPKPSAMWLHLLVWHQLLQVAVWHSSPDLSHRVWDLSFNSHKLELGWINSLNGVKPFLPGLHFTPGFWKCLTTFLYSSVRLLITNWKTEGVVNVG